MVNRLIAAIVLGILFFLLASIGQALLMPTEAADGLAWFVLLIALAVALFVAFRAHAIRRAWGHLFFPDGVLCLALAPASLFSNASAAELDYPTDYISEAAVRYAIRAALAGYLPIIAAFLALLLLAVALLLLLPRRSKHA